MLKRILLAISCVMSFVLLVYFGIRTYSRYAIGFTKVYVASHQLSQRKILNEEDLYAIEVPKDFIGDDVYMGKEDIVGKYVKLSYTIPKDSFIYKGAVEEDIKDLSHTLLKKGEVNYDIDISDIDINSSSLAVNMLVDFYLTIKDRDKPISDLLISDARITGIYDSGGKAISDYDYESRPYSISFAVRKDDVIILNKALVMGDLRAVATDGTYRTDCQSKANKESILFEYLD